MSEERVKRTEQGQCREKGKIERGQGEERKTKWRGR
jgi:hypothetical protein